MDVVLLRTLSEKSKIGFGKYKELTIYDLLKTKRFYLLWIYYYIDGITFNEDVLNKLNFTEEDKIKKPGTKPLYYEIRIKRIIGGIYKHQGRSAYFKFKNYMKTSGRKLNLEQSHLSRISKGELQRINQGKH